MKPNTLTRRQIVEACCYLNEAERSLHHVLNPACHRTDFVAYYIPVKVAALKQFARVFHPAEPTGDVLFPTVKDIWEIHRSPGFLRTILGVCFGALKSNWRIPTDEAARIGTVFDAMVQCLLRRDKPTDQQLIAWRMTTFKSHKLIAAHCPGLWDLPKARRVGWFIQLPHQPTFTIAEILRDVA